MSDASSTALSRTLYLRFLTYVKPHWRILAIALASTAAVAATESLFPALMKPLLDKGFAAKPDEHLWRIPLFIIGIFLLRSVLTYLSSYSFAWLSNRVVTELRQEMFERLIRLPTSYFAKNASSVAMTKITNDVNGVAFMGAGVVVVLVRDSLTVVALVAWLLYLNWKLTLVTFILLPVVALIIRAFSGRLRRLGRAGHEGMRQMTQTLQESIACQKVVKVFSGEAQETARFAHVNNALRGSGMRQSIAAAASVPITHLCAAVALAAVVWLALLQSGRQEVTVGDFVSFITAMLMLLNPLKHLADVNAPLQQGLAAAESIFQLLDEAPEVDRGGISLGRVTGRLELQNVSFAYPGAERNALSKVSLTVEPGQTVALVGPSGGGKTTLASLLPRFYRPTEGRILVDGNDLEETTLASLRANIALVSQEILLFDDTVANNIAYGAMRDASPAAIEAAASAAHALEFIRALPQGFDTVIGENGARLSGGQRQRIAIARAILKDAPVLILDEATSALDNESERQVQAALETLMQGRTTVVIAHRLSTIEGADRIVVLQHGVVAETGTHRELIARGGVYASFHRLQVSDLGMPQA